MPDRSAFIDLSHPIISGADGYPSLPVPRIEPHISHAASRSRYDGRAEFEISRVFMVGNTGTYLDSPYHRFADAPDVAALPLASMAGLAGVALDAPTAPGSRAVEAEIPDDVRGAAVLLRTGWDERRGTSAYWKPAPFVSRALADRLVAGRPALVGIDAWNIDDVADPGRPAHTLLLEAGILVVEHLARLGSLPPTGFRFFAVPAPVRGAASFPVRAFAELPPTGSF